MNIDANWTKEQVIKYLDEQLKTKKSQSTEDILAKFNNEEIDGEAFCLLSENIISLVKMDSKAKIVLKNIINKVEKNILKLKDNVAEDKIYKQVHKEDLEDIWNSLDEKLNVLKLGEKCKFIKYLLIRDPPPCNENQMPEYLKKIIPFLEDDIIDDIKENLNNLTKSDSSISSDQYEVWSIKETIDKIKLMLIIKLIKDANSNQEREEESCVDESIPDDNDIKSFNFRIYSILEVYEYTTSQKFHSKGIKNPIDEFKQICKDFQIECDEECNNINYGQALKLKFASFMLWGSKEGLKKFLTINKFECIKDYFEIERKAGIYLCVNENEKIIYLIVWPGEYIYKYSRIEEPNNNLLLTLIRYGFSFTSNSILCIEDSEFEEFDYNGFRIFEETKGLESSSGTPNTEINTDKSFKIHNKNILIKGIKYEFNNIQIIESKIRQNCILFYEKKNFGNSETEIYLYEISQIKDSIDLSLLKIGKMEKNENFETTDYFPQHNRKDLNIVKNNTTNKLNIYFRNNSIEDFEGLYDYDPISDTLILYKEEILSNKKIKKLGLYFYNGKGKTLYLSDLGNIKLNKISLIPSSKENKNKIVLLFSDKEIYAFQINDTNLFPINIDLVRDFEYHDYKDFQFIVHNDFLLVLKYDKDNKWIGKVYCLIFEDDSFLQVIAEISLEANKSNLFSFYEMNDRKYLISLSLIHNRPNIIYWEIISKLSKITTNFNMGNLDQRKVEKIPLGNCIVNYFYHCFEKYNLIGSIEYAKRLNAPIKLKIFAEKTKIDQVRFIKIYIKNLVGVCENNKAIKFEDIKFEFFDDYKILYKEKNSSLGEILLKVLEATPIQIAKIIGNEFEIMSDWESIDKKVYRRFMEQGEENKIIKFKEYTDMINFCMKDSIFNYFNLPIIVICCFGTQSVGKSTFLNELTGSIFGMRCTEGIWMSVKIFMALDNGNENGDINCSQKCKICKEKPCCLLMMHEDNCICENCRCGENCELKGNSNCKEYCCLEKNHKELSECSFQNCNCKCKCNCKCDNHNIKHSHLCIKCAKNNQNICNCQCRCRHLCKIPIIRHNFICVSLDFEGLGTFERRSEQDIQMALVGSAIGNNIIFRMGPYFDRFTENFLDKLSEASKNINHFDLEKYFGGALCFSPKDVSYTERENMKIEFVRKLNDSVRKWINDNSESQIKKNKNEIFGLFKKWIWIPTPNIKMRNFYQTLRENINREIIEKALSFHRHPIYKTGKEFCKNIKLFLSVVYFHRYDILVNYREEMVDEYITNNKEHAFQICGILLETEISNEQNTKETGDIKIYIKDNVIKNLEVELMNNKKFNINNELIINDITNINSNIIIENFRIEKYNILIITNKIKETHYSIEIKNFDDFGLMLKIPDQMQNEINNENLCNNIYRIWDSISVKIGLNEKEASLLFKNFIDGIIKRRNKNVSKWLEELTNNFPILKEKYNQVRYLSPLDSIWIICNEKCYHCFNKCYLPTGHRSEHQCFYDHKCKKKCSICEKIKCKNDNCNQICSLELSHPESSAHTCNHFHSCLGICYLYDYTKDCKKVCILEYGHIGKHFCGLNDHLCNGICSSKEKARNCNENCIKIYPHEGEEHDCKNKHLCKEICYLNENEGCKNICKNDYGHSGNHICDGKHICKLDCSLKNIAGECRGKCVLEYPHDGQHKCSNEHHKCLKDCIYKDKCLNCNNKCSLDYGHQGDDICGNEHICKENCSLINLAYGCEGRCILKHPHNELHNCGKVHKCKGICYRKEISQNCKVNCSLRYKHIGDCICDRNLKHTCNKNCVITQNCTRKCCLQAGHNGDCLCNQCNCQGKCRFETYTRNCNISCKYKAGETHQHHECNATHLCLERCKYCDNYCCKQYPHSDEHICNIKLEAHNCRENCYYYQRARNCGDRCNLKLFHRGNHNCSQNHLCNSNCSLFGISNGCQKICILQYEHNGEHLCQIRREQHICNKECYLYQRTRSGGCNKYCIKPYGHPGNCICSKNINDHKCNQNCTYEHGRGCTTQCIKQAGHTGEHICTISHDQHKCNQQCKFKNNQDANNCNNEFCQETYRHTGDHLCTKNYHYCTEPCSLRSISGCNGKCKQLYGSRHEHKCEKVHRCNKKCYFYLAFETYPEKRRNCRESCCLEYQHKGKCICVENNTAEIHPCYKNCSLYNAGGCGKKCEYCYDHSEPCQCKIDKNNHTCLKLCELCKNSQVCGHVYNHENDNSLRCVKCNNGDCELRNGGGHLCGSDTHTDGKSCGKPGRCPNKPSLKLPSTYTTNLGEKISFQKINYGEFKPEKCQIYIPRNKKEHDGVCYCRNVHLCQAQCKQCGAPCTKEYRQDHVFHSCIHGNIKNSSIYISNKNEHSYATVIKDDKEYKLTEGEIAQIFSCDKYCREQGQGHTHIFTSEYRINEQNNQQFKLIEEKDNKYIYECKCSYFWEKILKCEINPTQEEKKRFNLCNWKCKDKNHQTPEYCQLPLWHEPTETIPSGIYGKSVYNGHVFKCSHPRGAYNIFLIDCSGSMESKSEEPSHPIIKDKMCNMLGAAIQEAYRYCKIRAVESYKDKCAFFGFDDEVYEVLKDKSIDENEDFLNECLNKLKPLGATYFLKPFEKAFSLFVNSEFYKTELIPVIILLTDGLAHDHEETLSYIENMMKEENNKENGCKIFSILFKNKAPQYEFGKFKGKAEEIVQRIAELGGTKNFKYANDTYELSKIFREINQAIKTEFGLLFKET